MDKQERPTKKQFELLEFVENFVKEHGYGPSYREIMNGCNYTSVATVAVHVNNLIKKGLLSKNGRSARSLEVVNSGATKKIDPSRSLDSKEKWLKEFIEVKFAEADKDPTQDRLNKLEVLIGALKIIGFESAANSFMARLSALKDHLAN